LIDIRDQKAKIFEIDDESNVNTLNVEEYLFSIHQFVYKFHILAESQLLDEFRDELVFESDRNDEKKNDTRQNASQFAKTIIFVSSIESIFHQMNFINDDETNSIAKFENLQDFS
jgi:hypothetical protein